jgi:hypothetical protein
MRRAPNILTKPMNPGKVVVVVAGALLFFLAIRIIFNPRPVVYVLSFPYGVIAASAASRKLWTKLKTRLRPPKRAPLPENAETQ